MTPEPDALLEGFPPTREEEIPALGAGLCAGTAAPGRCQPHTNGAAAVLSSADHRLGTRGLGTFASEGSRWHRSLRSASAALLRWSPRGCSSPRGVSWRQQQVAPRHEQGAAQLLATDASRAAAAHPAGGGFGEGRAPAVLLPGSSPPLAWQRS